jgi:adenylate cyclase
LFADIEEALLEITQVKDLMDNIFDSIASGVIATDDKDIITTFNNAAVGILAMPSDESIGQKLTEVLPRLTSDLSEQLEEVRQSNQGQTFETELNITERGRVALNLKFNPLKDSDDNVQGVAMVLDDITDKREREQQIMTIKTYLPPEMVDNIATISSLALGGESREVTCIFAEMRSVYSLKEVHPRDILDMMNEYFTVATDCINATQGVVDKYMGTEVMALFNTQLNPQQNHSALAVECALMMRDAFLKLYKTKNIDPKPHYYRIGIHTGVCTLGNVGSLSRRDFTALGDTINLAKRVEENTPYGSIIISDGTKRHLEITTKTKHPYRFQPLGELKAKGRNETTPIYEVFRV